METKPSRTFSQKVPCGYVHCTIVEHYNGNFNMVLIVGDISKESCGLSWLCSMQKILTFSLRRAFEEDKIDDTKKALEKGILAHLEGTKFAGGQCYKYFASENMATSCCDGIAKCIKEYIDQKRKEENGSKE